MKRRSRRQGPDQARTRQFELELVGKLLVDGSAFARVAGLVDAEDLVGADLRLIFDAIRELAARGKAYDMLLVRDSLEGKGELEACGGREFLASLVEDTPSGANVEIYARKVRGFAIGRKVATLGEALARDAHTTEDVGALIAEHARAIAEISPASTAAAPPDPLAGVRSTIAADLSAGPEAIDAATPPRWLSYSRFPVCGAALAAPGSSGKTTLVLGEMVRVAAALDLYGDDVDLPGRCVFVSAEDGANYPRYLLQRICADGRNAGALSEEAVARAKAHVHVIGWSRAKHGPLMRVDELGDTHVRPVFDLLLELLAPYQPSYVTFDPSVLFGPGERHGNDAGAAYAALMHETALAIGALVQNVDHVAQAVARNGVIDQYASRGGTGKVDESRLARQLVRVAETDEPLPMGVTAAELEQGAIFRLHWTKPSYAPRPAPIWLRRRGHWFEHLKAVGTDEAAAQLAAEVERSVHRAERAVLAYVKQRIDAGERLVAREITRSSIPALEDGRRIKLREAEEALRRLLASGKLTRRELPAEHREGYRTTYIDLGPTQDALL